MSTGDRCVCLPLSWCITNDGIEDIRARRRFGLPVLRCVGGVNPRLGRLLLTLELGIIIDAVLRLRARRSEWGIVAGEKTWLSCVACLYGPSPSQ